ncbi:MAG: virulence protein [Eubacterium sp.]
MKINYNVTGARRKELAQTIGTALELKPKYMGMPSAAYQIGSFTLSKDGLLDYFESTDIEDVRKVLDAIMAAGFEPAEPVEPETEEESEEPKETAAAEDTEAQEGDPEEQSEETADLEKTLAADAEPESEDDGPAALSISLPDNLTDEAFENLKKVVASKQTLMKHAFQSKAIKVERNDGQIIFSGFTASDGDHTDAYMRYITLLTKFAKEAKRVTGKDYPVDNEKFAFRCFLIRIGMVGTEFKAARRVLLENLTGNSSWKNGAPEKAAPAEETLETGAETEVAVNE